MKAKKVTYSRLVSKGNYENAKIEIELEVEKDEKASEVFKAAKTWVQRRIEAEKIPSYEITEALRVVEDERNHTPVQVEAARKVIANWNIELEDDNLPF